MPTSVSGTEQTHETLTPQEVDHSCCGISVETVIKTTFLGIGTIATLGFILAGLFIPPHWPFFVAAGVSFMIGVFPLFLGRSNGSSVHSETVTYYQPTPPINRWRWAPWNWGSFYNRPHSQTYVPSTYIAPRATTPSGRVPIGYASSGPTYRGPATPPPVQTNNISPSDRTVVGGAHNHSHSRPLRPAAPSVQARNISGSGRTVVGGANNHSHSRPLTPATPPVHAGNISSSGRTVVGGANNYSHSRPLRPAAPPVQARNISGGGRTVVNGASNIPPRGAVPQIRPTNQTLGGRTLVGGIK